MLNEICVKDPVGDLQDILSSQQQRVVSYDDALEIGSSLIEFFTLLAEATDESAA